MTHSHRLREIAKFVAGLVAGDLIFGLLLLASNSLPEKVMGLMITEPFAWFWVGIDIFVILVLLHYAWTPHLLEPHATSKSLFSVIGIIFAIVAIVHFLRLVFGWPVVINEWVAPMWISWIGVIVAAYIAYASFHFAAKHGRTV